MKVKIDKSLELEVIDLIGALVNGDFDKNSAKSWYEKLNEPDINAKISECGNTLVLRSDSTY